MFRVSKMSGAYYAAEFDDLERELPNLEGLLEAGDHVLLVVDLDDAARAFDIDVDDIVVVDAE